MKLFIMGLTLCFGLSAQAGDTKKPVPAEESDRQEIFLDQKLMETFSVDDEGNFKLGEGTNGYSNYGIFLDPESRSTTNEMETAQDNPFRHMDRNRNDFSQQTLRDMGFDGRDR